MNKVSNLCCLICLAFVVPTFAQAPGQPPVPKNSCVKPSEPEKNASADKKTEFKNAAFSYKSCLENYLTELEKLSAPYLEAGNMAVGEYNAYTKKIKFAPPPADANKK